MEKTKLGLSVNLVAALCFVLAYFGGYIIAPIAMAYILLFEENKWLKRISVKAVLVMILFSLLSVAIAFPFDLIDWFMDNVRVFKELFGYNVTSVTNQIHAVLSDVLYFIKLGVYALLVVLAAFGRSFRVLWVDSICDKCIDK